MIALLIAVSLASDPAALRQLSENGPLVDLSTEAIGVAMDTGPVLLGASHAYHSHIAVHGGLRQPLIGAQRTWGIDAFAAVGIAGLLATPGIALTTTGALIAGARSDRVQATLGLVVPLSLRIDAPPQLALPLCLELSAAVALGPLWFGARGQAGATLQPSGPPAMRLTIPHISSTRMASS